MSYLVGVSVVMAVFAVAVAVFVSRRRTWNGYTPSLDEGTSGLRDFAGSPVVWALSFLFVVGGLLAGVVVAVSGTPEQQVLGAQVVGVVGAILFVSYVGYGTYLSSRSRGLTSAVAAMVSAWALGSLFVIAITVSLLIG